MSGTGLAADLAWWRAHRDAPHTDAATQREVLERLRAWKAQHDADRSGQANPFFRMVWDGVFGDEDGAVTDAIAELEAALGQRA